VAQEPVRLKYRSLPAEPPPSPDGPRFDLKVIFTDLPKTAAALATARTMARGLGARITVMMAQVVPYPLPLAEPDVPVEFTQRLLQSIAVEDATVEIYLCRDRKQTIRHALPPDSLVIVGARKRHWWPSWEYQLTKILRQDGRRVLVVTV
jgi:hypothetical protein